MPSARAQCLAKTSRSGARVRTAAPPSACGGGRVSEPRRSDPLSSSHHPTGCKDTPRTVCAPRLASIATKTTDAPAQVPWRAEDASSLWMKPPPWASLPSAICLARPRCGPASDEPSRWSEAMSSRYDLIILGGGAAAFSAAIRADRNGAKALMIDGGTLGGTCVNVGCVPSKRLLAVGDQFFRVANHPFPGLRLDDGWSAEFRAVIRSKDRLVADLRKAKYADVLASLKDVEYVRGHAAFVSPHEVKVGKERYEGDKFVVGTGSSPAIPSLPGIDKVDYLTNVEALSLKERPNSMIVLGGRALGLEFAQMYQHLGTRVKVLQRSPRIVPEEEPEISQYLEQYLKEDGGEIHTGAEILSADARNGRKVGVARVGGLKMDYRAVPHAVFTNPAVASVGPTDAKADADGRVRCTCNTIMLKQVPKPLIVEDTRGLVKIVAEAKSHKILGVHILASLAPDIIQEGVLAVKHGLTLEDIIDTVHVFPTHSEAVKLAALSFFEDVDKLSCCAM